MRQLIALRNARGNIVAIPNRRMVKMMIKRLGGLYCALAVATGLAMVLPAASLASAVAGTRVAGGALRSARAPYSGPRVRCVTDDDAYDPLAVALTEKLDRSLTGRQSSVGLDETDSRTGISCQYHAQKRFYAASAAKAMILAALLLQAQEQHRQLTSTEKGRAWLMITDSDNDAAQDLYEDVGLPGMQHFLDLAQMRETKLSAYFGLSMLTAHDEAILLGLLASPNQLLSHASRAYALSLMASVTHSQRWGTPAGAPSGVTVHVKNGWLPYPGSTWEINSLGIFTAPHRCYVMAVLTYDNPSMNYGISTIEAAARVMHSYLNAGPVSPQG
jgi:beta-lactamase class A